MGVIWLIIYISFLIGDFFAPGFWGITLIKLFGLFTCLAHACYKSKNDHLLIIALSFTILSDVILAINNLNSWGIFTFCLAHFFHLSRLAPVKNSKFLPAYLLGVGLIFLFGVMQKIPPLLIIGFIYAITLMSNLFLARRWYYQSAHALPARHCYLGFLLFVACDLCVVLSYFSLTGTFPSTLYGVANYLAWAFYFPSQILICSSGKSVVQ